MAATTDVQCVEQLRSSAVEEIQPLITGVGIQRGDLEVCGVWQDGVLTVRVADTGSRSCVFTSRLAVGLEFAQPVLNGLQLAMDQLGLEPKPTNGRGKAKLRTE